MAKGLQDTNALFSQRRQAFTEKKEKLEQDSNRLSNLRLAFFLIATALTILAFLYLDHKYAYTGLIIGLLLFIAILIRHEKVIKQVNYYRNMAAINQACLQRLNGEWAAFTDNGQEYQDANHPYSKDLDIFGSASLFQWLNTSNTYYGRETLKQLLACPDKDLPRISMRQQAIRELASQLEFCQALQCAGIDSGDHLKNPEKLFSYTEDGARFFKRKGLVYFIYILPFLTLTAILLSYLTPHFSRLVPAALITLQLIINFWGGKKVNLVLETVYAYRTKISVYQQLFELLEKQSFADPYLNALKDDLFYNQQSASLQIRKLDKIVGAIAFKYNPIIYFIVNTLFFWDFHCLLALEKWKNRSGQSVRKWVFNLGIYEALASLAMISQLYPDWTFAAFEQEELLVKAEDLGHPLIKAEQRVHNKLQLNNQIAIITGSNMSGKTTLLRTVGVNLVLAYAGAAVCAGKFNCSILEIYTSMRISDDLNSGISTFYAELLRIKLIIDFSRQKQKMIFLIDEVFRGTNSLDRVSGARNVLLNLNQPWIIGLISTHDYELCVLEEKSNRVNNYHFIENYHENEIHFDYLLKPGPCKTSNAKYLMKMAGIELLD